MAALPYIQIYVADYLADTMHLTAEEHGAYILLIMNYWQTGKPIPKKRLKSIAKISNERWTDVEEVLSEFFNDDGEVWQHNRIDADLDAVKESQNKKKQAGKASARARAAKNQAKNKGASTQNEQVFNDCSTNDASMFEQKGNYTDTDTDTDTDIKKNKQKKFAKPDLIELENFFLQEIKLDFEKSKIEAGRFFDYYESKGWLVGKAPMKNWQAAVRNWARNAQNIPQSKTGSAQPGNQENFIDRHTDTSWANDLRLAGQQTSTPGTQEFVARHTDDAWREGL